MPPENTNALDDLLLDVAAFLELSDRDRSVAENRYRILKEILERPSSPFRELLNQTGAMIYAQGSIATGTTIINGADEDRFDLDAIVQCRFPMNWSNDDVLDALYDTLKNFPGAIEVERCTRCVQVRFAFMHLDVTLLDRNGPDALEHAGEIFHSPDDAPGTRVPANPYGFAAWYRGSVGKPNELFEMQLADHRRVRAVDRLSQADVEARFRVLADAEQHDLPEFIPARFDAPKSIALKLIKRFLNLQYAGTGLKRPPSIYLAKVCAECEEVPASLTLQTIAVASSIHDRLVAALANGTKVFEANPTYSPDIITDRWPNNARDMEVLAGKLKQLCERLVIASNLDLKSMVAELEQLFGERAGQHIRDSIKSRHSVDGGVSAPCVQRGSGAIAPTVQIGASDAYRQARPHHFHCSVRKNEKPQ